MLSQILFIYFFKSYKSNLCYEPVDVIGFGDISMA
jgi:hypothetical protein